MTMIKAPIINGGGGRDHAHRVSAVFGPPTTAFILVLLVGVRAHAAMSLPRAEARKVVEQTIANVRAHMNSDPEVVRYAFDDVAASIPEDSRMLDLCAEVVLKSTNRQSVLYAMEAAHNIAAELPLNRKKAVAVIFRQAAQSGDAEVRRYSAYYLGQLDESFREDAYRSFKRLIVTEREPFRTYQLMVPAFGHSPDVIFFFSECAQRSSDTKIAQDALSALRIIANGHGKRHPEVISKAASAFETAFAHASPAVQLNAAFYLQELGNKYSALAKDFYNRLIRRPFGQGPEWEQAKSLAVSRILLPLLDSSNSENEQLLRDAETVNHLLTYFEATRPGDPVSRRRLSRWKSLVQGKAR